MDNRTHASLLAFSLTHLHCNVSSNNSSDAGGKDLVHPETSIDDLQEDVWLDLAPGRDDASVDSSTVDADRNVSYLLDVPRSDDGQEPVYTYSDLRAVRVFTPVGGIYPPVFVTTSDGAFWGWGANQAGYFQPIEWEVPPIPVSPTIVRLRPQRISGISDVREVIWGDDSGLCALAGVPPEGRIFCWGYTAYSGAGITHRESWDLWRYPRQMGDISDVRTFGYPGDCIWGDHGLWSFGLLNSEWHFFDVSGYVSPPRRFVGEKNGILQYEGGVVAVGFAARYATHDFQPQDGIVMIAGDYGYACVLLDTGRVRCFGHNQAGQTGNGFDGSEQICGTLPLADGGTTPTPAEPCVSRLTEVPGLTDVVKISLNIDSTCALKRDGTVWCWGWDPPMRNGMTALGYGGVPSEFCVPPGHPEMAVPCRKHPTQVVGITDAIDMSLGPGNSCAVRRNGSVVCWGNNDGGQLGDWTLTDRATPVTVRWH